MREILFRGKRPNGCWVQGNLTQFCIDGVMTSKISNHDLRATLNGLRVSTYTNDVIPETVGEYTGLTDINGTMIFEGDLLENGDYIGVVTANTYNCSCCHCVYGFAICDSEGIPIDDMHFVDSEKIGNIHDNPELLKERKKC